MLFYEELLRCVDDQREKIQQTAFRERSAWLLCECVLMERIHIEASQVHLE